MDNPGLFGKSLRVAAVGTGLFSIVYCVLAAGLLRRWFAARSRSDALPNATNSSQSGMAVPARFLSEDHRRDADATPPIPPVPFLPDPVTFFRPLKSGEPGLARNLEIFLEAVEPGDRVLFGAHSPEQRELCRDLARKFSHLDIRCPPLDHLDCLNPKIEKLLQLEPHAIHDRWIVLDSDTMAGPEFFRDFRSEWQESGADAFSAPYVFDWTDNLPARLDADGTELSLWPGVAILRAAGRVDFLTGACMAVRAPVLRGLGGWRVFANELADDHELGRAVSRSGGRVGISKCVASLAPPRANVPDWLLHQHRVFATFRRCNPSGFLGLPLTFGLAFSFLSLLSNPLSPALWLLHLFVSISRQAVASALPGRPRLWPDVWLTGLVEPLFWAASLLPLPVRWAGKWIRPAHSDIERTV